MIDTHCHLEQPDYDFDRDSLIERCKKNLTAIITSCANPKDLDLTLNLVKKYNGFVFAYASIHPKYINFFTNNQIDEYFKKLSDNKDKLVAIGETGLDYHWITEEILREKQIMLFKKCIELSKKLNKPLVIHSRKATDLVMEILEANKAEKVQMHMFMHRTLLKRVINNGWRISINTLLLRSKNIKKIVRDCPLEKLMLETDSPWLGLDENGKIVPKNIVRNDPLSVRFVAEKIAEIKKIDFEKVVNTTSLNAINFYNLRI